MCLKVKTPYYVSMDTASALVPVSLFISNLKSLSGIPYIWGGKDPHGLDCSGCITYALLQSDGPDLTADHNCERLIRECREVQLSDWKPGLLAFYGPGVLTPNHVMAILPFWVGPDVGLHAYGACGGNHHTLTPDDARRIGAQVQYRPKVVYRHDFLGAYEWNRLDYGR